MDQIQIRDLEVYAKHGVMPEENTLGQKFQVNLNLYTDLWEAGHTDHIDASINYAQVCQLVTEYMTTHTVHLIEMVAESLARELLLQIPRLHKVDVEVKKPWAPIGLPVSCVSVAITRQWETVYLSVGSNLGEREQYIRDAVAALQQYPEIRNVQVSSLIETEPYGKTDQPRFLNGAISLETMFLPHPLLDTLHEIEQAAGRERKEHWGPRTLDLDILLYGQQVICDVDLTVPHADMTNRRFVLEPLAELAPWEKHPVLGESVSALLQKLPQE